MADLRRDYWIREIGTGQQVAQLHDRQVVLLLLMMMMIIKDIKKRAKIYENINENVRLQYHE
jgi:hypothetical protein